MKIISIGKIYRIIERYASGVVIASTIIIG